jgi:hypothetical protein
VTYLYSFYLLPLQGVFLFVPITQGVAIGLIDYCPFGANVYLAGHGHVLYVFCMTGAIFVFLLHTQGVAIWLTGYRPFRPFLFQFKFSAHQLWE